jgi:hypothetical protein
MISPTAMSAPEPAEVTPSTNPTLSPIATAAVRMRGVISRSSASPFVSLKSSARPSVATPHSISAAATAHSTKSSKPSPQTLCSQFSTTTPPRAPGTLPKASHPEIPRLTVPFRKWRQPPTVFVIAA